MKTSAKSILLKNNAKNVMAGKYYVTIMTLLFYGMATILFYRFVYALNNQVCLTLIRFFKLAESSLVLLVMSYLIPLLLSMVLNVLQIGMCLFFLNLAVGNPCYTIHLLYGYYHNFGKSFCVSGVMTLLSFVCFLPADLLMEQYQQGTSDADGQFLLTLIGIQLVLLLVYFPLALTLSQVYYVMLDYPELSVPEIFKMSVKIMKGKKLQLFYVQLSFLPLFFLGMLSFGLGFLWVIPYRNATYVLYYLDLMKPENPQS